MTSTNLPELKANALENSKPLVVVVCNSRTCSYCKEANTKIFNTDKWNNYVEEKGIQVYHADAAIKEANQVKRALHREYNNPAWPAVLIFKMKETADLTNNALDSKNNVELIGKFLYRVSKKKLINGIKVEITPENFIQVIESFYKDSHPEWL